MLEKALAGVDTTTRLQTVWQVKVLANVGRARGCEDPIDAWDDLVAPSAGRLTTSAVAPPASDDPCIISPAGGYRGLENRLYRVEIHTSGPLGTAKFKWSRDNGSIVSAVEAISAGGHQLTVRRIGRDQVLRFQVEDWVEVLDDHTELKGQAGHMGKVANIDEANRILTIPAIPASFDANDSSRHTRVRRWDQTQNVDANGLLDVIAGPVTIEDGIEVSFSADPTGGDFKVGDYWVFAARTADGSVEMLDEAPPRGILHHYCRLALIDAAGNVTNCRPSGPPETRGEGCDCSVCVTADSHNDGTQTIHWAIDQVKVNGGTVCLGAGVYNLGGNPVHIAGAQSVRLKGQGWKTQLMYAGTGSAVIIENSQGVVIEELTFLTSGISADASPGVSFRNCWGITFQRNIVLQTEHQEGSRPAIGMEGYLFGTFVRENVLVAAIGIANTISHGEARVPYLLTAGLYVQDNILLCEQKGISLEGSSFHFAETRLSGHFVLGFSQSGISAVGTVFPGSHLDVCGNELHARGARGDGIVVGTDNARVNNNDISAVAAGQGGAGIVLKAGLDPAGIDRCQVLGNRITGVGGHGIALRTAVRSAMIKHNIIDGVGGGGIVMEEGSASDGLSIENNQLLNVAPETNVPGSSVAGIRLLNAKQAQVTNNLIRGLGQAAVQNPSRAGIQVIASPSVRIVGNELVDIGPPGEFVSVVAGIEVLPSFDRVEVVDNRVRRSLQPPAGHPGCANWYGLRILGSVTDTLALDDDIMLLPVVENAVLVFTRNRLRLLPRGGVSVVVRANLVEAHFSSVSVVNIIGEHGACVFSDNRCLLGAGSDLAVAAIPIASVGAGTLIVGANYFEGPRATVAVNLEAPERHFTVLGNIASGPIQINHERLDDPWAPLNAIIVP